MVPNESGISHNTVNRTYFWSGALSNKCQSIHLGRISYETNATVCRLIPVEVTLFSRNPDILQCPGLLSDSDGFKHSPRAGRQSSPALVWLTTPTTNKATGLLKSGSMQPAGDTISNDTLKILSREFYLLVALLTFKLSILPPNPSYIE